jgi:hypothetical protein
MENNICQYCSKEFSSKVNLLQHQKTVKSCLKLQGKKETNIDCQLCKKSFSIKYYNQTHKLKCTVSDKDLIIKLKEENEKLKLEIIKLQNMVEILKEQNSKPNVVNNVNNNTVNNKTVLINTSPLTNDILRQCATTFTIDNAYNITGITKHLTNSLEDHITCTDPSRNVFKYTNEKEQEIVDQDLDILLPQYLTAIKDRNNFLYKEVFDYFKKNNVSPNVQTDYKVFYDALNSIIEKNGQQNKYSEKCKQHMVRECKRRFLEKNKNKDKTLMKKLTIDEVMMNVIETGGTVTDFVKIVFPEFLDEDTEETEEEIKYRRETEDSFIKKKKEWRLKQDNI